MKKPKMSSEWYKLDNAAKIYPSTNNSRWNCVYRCSAVLKSRVDREVLQVALDDVLDRYPTFKVMLKKGVFWYYFQGTNCRPVVTREETYPCAKFDIRSREPLLRVLYHHNRLSVEIFHSLTDGYGGVNFLNTLLLRYFHILGKKIDKENVLHYEDNSREEEIEDSFIRYYDPTRERSVRRETPAYHITGTPEIEGIIDVIHGEVDTGELVTLAKSKGVSVNQYIVGVLTYICYKRKMMDNKVKRRKPIKIQVAINLRHLMPSTTLRNFSAFANVPLEEKFDEEMTFDEVLNSMTRKSKEMITEENMVRFINSNCDVEKKWYVRVVPLFLKTLAMKIAFYKVGEDLFTFFVSNIGKINAPKEFENYIDRYEFILGAQKYNHNSLSVGSFNNKTVFTFTRTIKSPAFERNFFRFLSEQGLKVRINSNRGDTV